MPMLGYMSMKGFHLDNVQGIVIAIIAVVSIITVIALIIKTKKW